MTSQSESLIRNISDTAFWSAVYRARETERKDALFHDVFDRRLTGVRGEQIAETLKIGKTDSAFGAVRTYLFDQFITESVQQGVDMVVSLAAGLDASPYRMKLPPTLKWVEVDLPELISYKEEILKNEKPVCSLERIKLDLSQVAKRRELFKELGARAKNAFIITEGLVIYLSPNEAISLAQDLAVPKSFQRWALELSSPGLLKMIQKKTSKNLTQAGAPLKFGPKEGPEFFKPYGWNPADVRSMMKTAAQLKRLPKIMQILAMLPESKGKQGSRPWAGVCLLQKQL